MAGEGRFLESVLGRIKSHILMIMGAAKSDRIGCSS
jgi:hypothetical protein